MTTKLKNVFMKPTSPNPTIMRMSLKSSDLKQPARRKKTEVWPIKNDIPWEPQFFFNSGVDQVRRRPFKICSARHIVVLDVSSVNTRKNKNKQNFATWAHEGSPVCNHAEGKESGLNCQKQRHSAR